ncbi:phage protein [Listeria floridensis FSL S10-1187]|uniref:Phage protein n=2 Tax=Listeria floridensis TaxID=1494962 RepID=A0ABP3AWB3_9LIST|nr:phage protein [Listeria floridensis FSL S10-1187]
MKRFPLTSKQMVKLLHRNGFHKVVQHGIHLKMYSPFTKQTVIVPMHNNELGKGLERSILKQAGLISQK